jgi:hypothetical protein
MLSRRRFVQVVGLSLGAWATPMNAAQQCGPWLQSAWGPYRRCAAEVPLTNVFALRDQQYQSQWCWAACISMVFRHHGYPVAQSRIVSEVYGAPVNMPAGTGAVLAQALNRSWLDDRGRRFTSRVTGVFDFDARFGNLSNEWMINELASNRPFVMGARTHAMVVTKIVYETGNAGTFIREVGVVDPWPGIGLRGLAPDEMVAAPAGSFRFAATVTVS